MNSTHKPAETSKIFYISNNSYDSEYKLSGIAFTIDSTILDGHGLGSYKNAINHSINPIDIVDGRFISVIKAEKNEHVCKSDDFGQELVFYYHDGRNWAISNSLLHLAEKLKDAGHSLTLYEPTLLSFAISNQSMYGGQLLSHNTPIKEIKLLPYTKQIRLKKNLLRGYSFSIEQKPSSIKPINNLNNYRYSILEFVNTWQSRFEALEHAGMGSLAYELSGGYDSRINFGLLATNNKTAEKWTLLSDKSKPADYKAAEKLAGHYKLEIGKQSRHTSKGSDYEHFDIWRYGNAGHYIPLYKPASVEFTNSIKIHGANYRGRSYVATSAPKRIEKIKHALPEREGQMVADEFEQSFAEIGIDNIASPNAMHEHYTAFRARIHYGRNWFRRHGNILITPLLTAQLRAMTDYIHNAFPDAHPEQTTCDILHAIDPTLAKMPFDQKEKAFPKETIKFSKKLDLESEGIDRQKIKLYGFAKQDNILQKKKEKRKKLYSELLLEKRDNALQDERVTDIYWKNFLEEAKNEDLSGNLSKAGKTSVLINAKIFVDLVDEQTS